MKLQSSAHRIMIILGTTAWLLTTSAMAHAHAKLDQDSATSGASYRGAMLITHGCNDSPTVTVRIRLPSEVKRVKPMAKAGWKLEVIMEKLDKPYDLHGSKITEEVREIVWSGGSLSNDHFDEFVFRGTLPETESEMTLYFPTVQQCENGESHRWIEIPEAGQSPDDLEKPAPLLKISPEHHQH